MYTHRVGDVPRTVKKIPVKLTVKLLAAVLPTKNRQIYGQDDDNRYFLREINRKLYGQDGDNRKKITGKKRKNYGQYDDNRKRLRGETVNGYGEKP